MGKNSFAATVADVERNIDGYKWNESNIRYRPDPNNYKYVFQENELMIHAINAQVHGYDAVNKIYNTDYIKEDIQVTLPDKKENVRFKKSDKHIKECQKSVKIYHTSDLTPEEAQMIMELRTRNNPNKDNISLELRQKTKYMVIAGIDYVHFDKEGKLLEEPIKTISYEGFNPDIRFSDPNDGTFGPDGMKYFSSNNIYSIEDNLYKIANESNSLDEFQKKLSDSGIFKVEEFRNDLKKCKLLAVEAVNAVAKENKIENCMISEVGGVIFYRPFGNLPKDKYPNANKVNDFFVKMCSKIEAESISYAQDELHKKHPDTPIKGAVLISPNIDNNTKKYLCDHSELISIQNTGVNMNAYHDFGKNHNILCAEKINADQLRSSGNATFEGLWYSHTRGWERNPNQSPAQAQEETEVARRLYHLDTFEPYFNSKQLLDKSKYQRVEVSKLTNSEQLLRKPNHEIKPTGVTESNLTTYNKEQIINELLNNIDKVWKGERKIRPETIKNIIYTNIIEPVIGTKCTKEQLDSIVTGFIEIEKLKLSLYAQSISNIGVVQSFLASPQGIQLQQRIYMQHDKFRKQTAIKDLSDILENKIKENNPTKGLRPTPSRSLVK